MRLPTLHIGILDFKARIELILKYKQLSLREFAQEIELPNVELLKSALKENEITIEIAALICCRYPEINRLWIICGEGDVLNLHLLALDFYQSPILEDSSYTPNC